MRKSEVKIIDRTTRKWVEFGVLNKGDFFMWHDMLYVKLNTDVVYNLKNGVESNNDLDVKMEVLLVDVEITTTPIEP